MLAPTNRKLIGACLLLCLGFHSSTCYAYNTIDWMRMWPRYSPGPVAAAPAYTPAPTYLPPPPMITPGVPVAPGCGTPAPACGTALPAVGLVPAAPQSTWCSRLWGGGGTSGPEVRYRTSWVQVPTTNYRPVSASDPISGATTTTLRPCTTFTWQVQRVPASPLAPVAAPLYPASGCAVAGYTPVISGVAPGSCTTCAPAATVAPVLPYYTPGSAPGPAAAAPYGSSASPIYPPAQPTYPGQPTNPAQPRAPAAADQAPALSPNGAARSTLNYPPEGTPNNATPPASEGTKKSADPTPRSSSDVTPLPDPDATQQRKPAATAPSLLNARDRTAQRDSHAEPHSVSAAQPPIELTAPVTNPTTPLTGGWRSVTQ